jgi:hypothetical protein
MVEQSQFLKNREFAAATRSHPVADQACGGKWLWLTSGWHINFMCTVGTAHHSLVSIYSGESHLGVWTALYCLNQVMF